MRIVIILVLVLCNLGELTAQDDEIQWVNGKVLSDKGTPLKRAIIYLDSVKTKIKTNKKGEFRIGLKPLNKTISAYSWNHGVKTMKYNGEDSIAIVFPKIENIMSEENLEGLGFVTKIKRTKKKPKDYSMYLTMYQLIATEIPGARVNGTTVQLVPPNSVQNAQDPLIIVDGTPVSSMEFIFPREVESVRVLRDDSASFYGSRGASGVILIKMKN